MQATYGNVKRCPRVVAAVLLLGLSAGAWEVSATVVDNLPAELTVELQKAQWDARAIGELGQQQADWSQFRARDAGLVAAALEYARSEDAEIGPQGQAQMAVQVCSMIREMESLGYGETATARAVFAAVRSSLQVISAWRSGDGEGGLEQQIRSRFRHELRVQTAGETRTQARDRGRAETGADGPVVEPGRGGPPGKS